LIPAIVIKNSHHHQNENKASLFQQVNLYNSIITTQGKTCDQLAAIVGSSLLIGLFAPSKLEGKGPIVACPTPNSIWYSLPP